MRCGVLSTLQWLLISKQRITVMIPAPSNTLYTLVTLNSFIGGAPVELGIVLYKQYKLVMKDNLDG